MIIFIYDPTDFDKKFRSKSKWQPAAHQLSPHTLETIQSIQDSLINLRWGKVVIVTHNITKTQLNTIQILGSNNDIIIKSADKR